MASSTSSLRLLSLFAVDGKELSDSLPHFAFIILQLSITENMNALCFANISPPILQAFFKFIFILRIICSLKLFDNSTSPHSITRFIAGHSPIAYFNNSFNNWPFAKYATCN